MTKLGLISYMLSLEDYFQKGMGLVWGGLVLWLVGRLFGFYGISTLVDYLTPNSVDIYIHI